MLNYFKRLAERNRVFRLIDDSSRIGKRNQIIINSHNSLQHELVKAAVCHELAKRGIDFYTEAKFKNKGICDIICFNFKTGQARIIEILHSETLLEAKKKAKKYPDIEKIYIDTKAFNIKFNDKTLNNLDI